MIRLFVVSPTPAFRAGLRSLLGGTAPLADDDLAEFPGLVVVGEAADLSAVGNGHTPAELEPPWDILLLDARADDLDEMADLGRSRPGLRAVLLGPVDGDEQLLHEVRQRAWGYLARDTAPEALVAAVRAVAEGLSVIEPALAARWVAPRGPNPLIGVGHDIDVEELTGREREVLQLIAQGLPNKAIAVRLRISEHTVKFHVGAILGKLGAASRAEAVRLGARRGDLVL